ncbi:biotin-dependent carboxyltransferase family protein [Sphingobacterium sp. HMA12]|uniref:5-oxoprolinase subunit C family protein n=1 Tax=Sphingobacterium sp. HMA12 TaxID=2050894 RepID=UPI000CE9EBF3|nr:biotin-dependent carboxyltransferase family protein [Sphingobacterium sp. HMA12]
MGIKIVKAGMLTTIQDLGRYGLQRYGMAVSGAMDSYALRLGNNILGNPDNEAAIECTVLGPIIYFEQAQLICLTGADLSPMIDGNPLPMWRPVLVEAGSLLSFGRPHLGCRAYICFQGGLDIPEILGSRSTYSKGGLGGWQGRALHEGDRIPFRHHYTGKDSLFHWSMDPGLYPDLATEVVRVLDGPQFACFESNAQKSFFSDVFTISNNSDRMGYRLTSKPLWLTEQKELLSTAVTFGSIQVPPDGNAIVLMADHPTTGGYPVIAQVATIDLSLLAQKGPNDRISFKRVSLDEAHGLLKKQHAQLKKLKSAIALKYE